MPDAAADGASPGAAKEGPIGGALPEGAVADWATEIADRVIDGVDKLKTRTTRPVVTVLRAVVYGVILFAAVAAAAVFAVIGVVRIWDAYFPVAPLGRRVWLGYVAVGGLLFLVGGFLLSRRRAPHKS